MFHLVRATESAAPKSAAPKSAGTKPATTKSEIKKAIIRKRGRRSDKGRSDEGRSDEGPSKGTYDLGDISDDESRVVPQVVAPQSVKYTRLQDVLQEMINRFSAIPLHVSALDSLAVLV